MNEINRTKKQPLEDWHPADIVCALRKAGWTLRKLSIRHGYAQPTTVSYAIHKPWPKGERLIAEAIGVRPEEIWPSRYAARKEKSNRRRRRRHVKPKVED